MSSSTHPSIHLSHNNSVNMSFITFIFAMFSVPFPFSDALTYMSAF